MAITRICAGRCLIEKFQSGRSAGLPRDAERLHAVTEKQVAIGVETLVFGKPDPNAIGALVDYLGRNAQQAMVAHYGGFDLDSVAGMDAAFGHKPDLGESKERFPKASLQIRSMFGCDSPRLVCMGRGPTWRAQRQKAAFK